MGVHLWMSGLINGRHPDAGFVDFEEVGDEFVEVDVFFGVVEEGEFFVVARGVRCQSCCVIVHQVGSRLTAGTLRPGFPYEDHARTSCSDTCAWPWLHYPPCREAGAPHHHWQCA